MRHITIALVSPLPASAARTLGRSTKQPAGPAVEAGHSRGKAGKDALRAWRLTGTRSRAVTACGSCLPRDGGGRDMPGSYADNYSAPLLRRRGPVSSIARTSGTDPLVPEPMKGRKNGHSRRGDDEAAPAAGEGDASPGPVRPPAGSISATPTTWTTPSMAVGRVPAEGRPERPEIHHGPREGAGSVLSIPDTWDSSGNLKSDQARSQRHQHHPAPTATAGAFSFPERGATACQKTQPRAPQRQPRGRYRRRRPLP